jgi:hypothetical protein
MIKSILIDCFKKDKVEIQIRYGDNVFHLYPDKEQLLKLKEFLNENL